MLSRTLYQECIVKGYAFQWNCSSVWRDNTRRRMRTRWIGARCNLRKNTPSIEWVWFCMIAGRATLKTKFTRASSLLAYERDTPNVMRVLEVLSPRICLVSAFFSVELQLSCNVCSSPASSHLFLCSPVCRESEWKENKRKVHRKKRRKEKRQE